MRIATLLALLVGPALAQSALSLSGTVRDAEEGNGLKSVEVSLAVAGLRTTTAKNGDWSLDGPLSASPRPAPGIRREDGLLVEDGRLHLLVGGRDLRGRFLSGSGRLPPSGPVAARGTEAAVDTLVFSRDGYVGRRIPLASWRMSGRQDSIRRIRGPEWVDSSHSNGFRPDTTDAFPDTLRVVTFRFAKASWDSLMKAMADSCGKFGGSGSGGFPGMGSTTCQVGTYDLIDNNALIWVPVDLLADGQVWKSVGIRLKGNASLMTSWSKGSYALPFRINTDKFEDAVPTIRNQRFHGFKKIGFFNMEQDSSGVRGAVAGEIFRQSGIPAPMSVPVKLLLDRGDGRPLDVGVYEMLEIPDNPLLNRNFGNDSGNLYKPLSKLDQFVAAEWADEDVPGDRADAQALIAAINAPNRLADPAAWRGNLESVLDVRGFLKWLAVSTAIFNWDSYGTLAHNYYVFNDSGTFRFITYDFGWSFDYAMSSFFPRNTVWFDQNGGGGFGMDLGPFPLVKNALADPVYCQAYRGFMEAAIAAAGPAGIASFQAKVDRYGRMVSVVPGTVAPVRNLRDFMGPRIAEIQASLKAKTCPVK